jgi:hypothetical protein
MGYDRMNIKTITGPLRRKGAAIALRFLFRGIDSAQ